MRVTEGENVRLRWGNLKVRGEFKVYAFDYLTVFWFVKNLDTKQT